MIRTQVQLTEEQFTALKKISAAEGVSLAELIRQGVAQVLAARHGADYRSRVERALRAAGRFRSGVKDLSRRHDEYFAEAVTE